MYSCRFDFVISIGLSSRSSGSWLKLGRHELRIMRKKIARIKNNFDARFVDLAISYFLSYDRFKLGVVRLLLG